MPLFSKKLLFFIFFLIHAVKKSITNYKKKS